MVVHHAPDDDVFAGANVLITGGAGSVGRSLVRRLKATDCDVIRVIDNNEPSLAAMRTRLDDDRIRYLAGDVRDKERIERAMQGIDIVLHVAAMKHVDISEYNPFEAVKTNVVGLQNVIDTAIDSDAKRLIFTSSDKAVNPANTMGTTKLLGEKLVTAGNKYRGDSELRLGSVRFGNVIGSSGSVVPLFEQQIREGGPLTLTDDRMTRFFLTSDEMAELLVDACRLVRGGEVFIRKMSAIRIEDLAEVMRRELAPQYGHDPSSIDTDVIGRRVGETMHEEIMTEREANRAVENTSLYAIPPDAEADAYLEYEPPQGFGEATDLVRSSNEADLLDRSEIVSFLQGTDVMEAA
jgi:FlaA1/EpsC-like NDP-sugar epimerase